MKNTKRSAKKAAIKIIAVLSVIALGLSGCLWFTNSEAAKFVVGDKLKRIGASVDFKESAADGFESVSLEEARADDRVTFNDSLMLINSEHKILDDKQIEVVEFKDSDIFMQKCLLGAFETLRKDIENKFDGSLYVTSDFRTADEQREAIAEEGAVAQKVGASEHQAGLCLDVCAMYAAGKAFLNSEIGRFVNSDCWQYGFIVRYPFMKKHVTGIGYEPWHIRYVGAPHAKIITEKGITLEEYIEALEIGKFYTFEDYVIYRTDSESISLPEDFSSAVVSPDNCGNYIVTVK